MMTQNYIRTILNAIEYKNWSFRVGAWGRDDTGRVEQHWIQVEFYDDDGKQRRGRKWAVSDHATVSEVVQTALLAVLTAEEHEAREKFLYGDRAIFAPHFKAGELWALAIVYCRGLRKRSQADAIDERERT